MKAILITIAASFLLLCTLVGAKFMLEHHFASTTSGLQAEDHMPGIDLLLIGSSHTRQGYDVAELERQTNLKAFVVAYDGLDPSSMEPLLEQILSRPAHRPRLVVVEAYCRSLSRTPDIEDTRLFFDATPSLKLKLIRLYAREHGGWRAWKEIWDLAANRGSDTILSWPFDHAVIDGLSYHGGYLGKSSMGLSAADFRSVRLPVPNSTPNASQLDALTKVIATVRAAHVSLLLADPPMPAPVEAQPEVMALKSRFASLAAKNGIAIYEGAQHFPTGDPSLFHDSNHLSTAGRALYTSGFAQYLRERDPTLRFDQMK